MQICVIAKEPRAGFAKTRLTPPCTPAQAAAVAEAALADTLDVVARTPARRRVLALDGGVGRWLPDAFTVVPQSPGGLDERLEAAFAHCFISMPTEPVVLIGMDTPQVTADHLTAAGAQLDAGADAVLGPAVDGGYWLIGLRAPTPGAVRGIPMSTAHTGRSQLERLEQLGCAVGLMDTLDDIDDFATTERVARAHPHGRFGRTVRCLETRTPTLS